MIYYYIKNKYPNLTVSKGFGKSQYITISTSKSRVVIDTYGVTIEEVDVIVEHLV